MKSKIVLKKYINSLLYPNAIKLYYYNNKRVPNFGDLLNIDIVQFISKLKVLHSPVHETNFVAIGSLLELFLLKKGGVKMTDETVHVWGTGFIAARGEHPVLKDKALEMFSRNMKFHCVRGELSLARLADIGYDTTNIALGDPGLLSSLLLQNKESKKKFKLGIIPHYVDKGMSVIKDVVNKIDCATIIDIQQDPSSFLREIAQCETVISSAMHGLIAADSLHIPNRWVKLSDKVTGGDYKFNDYYSVFGEKPVPLSVDDLKSLTDNDIQYIKDNPFVSASNVEQVKQQILDAYPESI